MRDLLVQFGSSFTGARCPDVAVLSAAGLSAGDTRRLASEAARLVALGSWVVGVDSSWSRVDGTLASQCSTVVASPNLPAERVAEALRALCDDPDDAFDLARLRAALDGGRVRAVGSSAAGVEGPLDAALRSAARKTGGPGTRRGVACAIWSATMPPRRLRVGSNWLRTATLTPAPTPVAERIVLTPGTVGVRFVLFVRTDEAAPDREPEREAVALRRLG